jgi:ABC-2 type transport system ATP-binding protein
MLHCPPMSVHANGYAKGYATAGPAAVFENVAKSYGTTPALKGVSFEIRRGEVFGFIGPNGAGKTTTMKILVGLLGGFSGTVRVNGLSMPGHRTALYRAVGYLPQAVAFQDWRTVEHALVTLGRLSGMERPALAERIPEVLAMVGLEGSRATPIIHLSGGMTQKVGLAQALLHRPDLLVLDEPVAGLDPGSRIHVKSIIRALREEGTTVFFSSHVLSDVQDVADRIGIMRSGAMVTVGTLDELKAGFAVNDDVEIVLSRGPARLDDVARLRGVSGVEPAGPLTYLLHLAPDADAEAVSHEALGQLLAAGNRVRSFRPLAPSLDDLYLKLAGAGGAR